MQLQIHKLYFLKHVSAQKEQRIRGQSINMGTTRWLPRMPSTVRFKICGKVTLKIKIVLIPQFISDVLCASSEQVTKILFAI